MGNLDIYEKYRSAPKEALKKITGGRINGMTDINPMWRIKALTECFGPCGDGWWYTVTDRWTEKCGEEIAAFVQIELRYKTESGVSEPVIGTGGSMLYVKERNGLRISDEAYKMATTDAISVACKQLGFAADVYWDKDRTKYSAPAEQDTTPQNTQQNVQPVDPDLIPHGEGMTDARLNRIKSEMDRTGITEKTLLVMFHVKSLKDLTEAQYIAIINKFKDTPDKTA